jgi:hypothetical protein
MEVERGGYILNPNPLIFHFSYFDFVHFVLHWNEPKQLIALL